MEKRFEHFLQLKTQGVHFNEKLAASSALKNPGLFPKLMASAGLRDIDQHANALSKDHWDPSTLPPWAYKEELAKTQRELTLRKEEERSHSKRDSIDFVPAAAKNPIK